MYPLLEYRYISNIRNIYFFKEVKLVVNFVYSVAKDYASLEWLVWWATDLKSFLFYKIYRLRQA